MLDLLAHIFRSAPDHKTSNEDRDNRVDQHAVEAGANSSEDHLVGLHVEQRNQSANRCEAVVHSDNGAAARIGRNGGEERRHRVAEAHFLAFHVAARLSSGIASLNTETGYRWIPSLFGPIADKSAGEEHDTHRRKERPTLPRVTHHLPEHVRQSGSKAEDQQHLDQVRKGRRILVRMGRVCVGEPAAVRAQHLDSQLRRQRSLSDDLSRTFQGLHRLVRFEILNGALPHEKQRRKHRNGQEDIDRAAGHVDPQIPYGFRTVPGKPANQRYRNRDTHRCRNEVLDRECGHLHEVAHRGFRDV